MLEHCPNCGVELQIPAAHGLHKAMANQSSRQGNRFQLLGRLTRVPHRGHGHRHSIGERPLIARIQNRDRPFWSSLPRRTPASSLRAEFSDRSASSVILRRYRDLLQLWGRGKQLAQGDGQ